LIIFTIKFIGICPFAFLISLDILGRPKGPILKNIGANLKFQMVAPIPFRGWGESPNPGATRGFQIPLPQNNLPLRLAFIQAPDHQGAVSNEEPHSGEIAQPFEVAKRRSPPEVQRKRLVAGAPFLQPLGRQVPELGGKIQGDGEVAARGETGGQARGQARGGLAEKGYRRLVVQGIARLVQFLHCSGAIEINAGDVGGRGLGLAAVAGQVQDIGQDHLLETTGQLGQGNVVAQACP